MVNRLVGALPKGDIEKHTNALKEAFEAGAKLVT